MPYTWPYFDYDSVLGDDWGIVPARKKVSVKRILGVFILVSVL